MTRARAFPDALASEEELGEHVREPAAAAWRKEIDHLDEHCRAFLARSPFFVLATTAADGTCDASPRGGPPGFVEALDDHRLRVQDFPGNRRQDSHRNILATGRAGLLFVIPGLSETLRVNGRASLLPAPEPLALGIEVEEAFLHCAKAFIRSSLWEPSEWPDRADMATPAQILRDHAHLPLGIQPRKAAGGVVHPAAALDVEVEVVQAGLDESYRERLY